MALRRSRGRGWIKLADRGSVESVARPHHHRLLRRHPRHSRLRSPQVQQLLHCRRRSKVVLRGLQPHPRVVSYIQRARLYGLYALGFIRIDWQLFLNGFVGDTLEAHAKINMIVGSE
ncbi:hypothetical protein FCV25MIE_24859 [Fagus crenata]